MLAVGLMSGTSLDGIDAVLCEITGFGLNTKIEQKNFIIYPLPASIKETIKRCCKSEGVGTDVICSLNFELGELFSNAAQFVCAKAGIATQNLDFISCHGQTIYHIPRKTNQFVASTLQIGESAVIAQNCGCTVISNFRTKDMAAGGEGAPLVPYSEYILYRNTEHAVALQNIGGIGNVTVLPKECQLDDVYAFDTGPGNMTIDEAMLQMYGKPYDDGGKIASTGEVINKMMNELKQHSYINMDPPKTTGREMFGPAFVHHLLKKYCEEKPNDIIKTLTWFTAWSIAENYRKFILPKDNLSEVILGGGGAHNKTLQQIIQSELPNISILTQEEKGFSSDAKEAIAFVILGNETLHHNPSNVPRATGAKQKVILGNITYPN
ncbi:MAG: anhydro-N-acetylmuramic acid kinase AnmK [Clostridium sp.]